MRWVLCTSFFLLISQAAANNPEAISDYVDSEVREVEVAENLALNLCLSSNDVSGKFESAYTKCFGKGYDWESLADESGAEGEFGMSEDYEKKEVCFYKTIGWTDGTNLEVAAIKADMKGMDASIKTSFEQKVVECKNWSPARARVRRDVSPQESSLINTIRKKRASDNGGKNGGKGAMKGKGKKGGKGAKNGGKGGRNGRKRSRNGKKGGKGMTNGRNSPRKGKKGGKIGNGGKNGKGGKNGRNRPKKGKGGKKGKNGTNGKGGNNGKGDKNRQRKGNKCPKGNKCRKGNNKGKGGKGKGENTNEDKLKSGQSDGKSGGVDDNLYAQLWCADLAFEQALQQCVEQKMNAA